MEFELDVLKGFDSYCRKKREQIDKIEDKEHKARLEKVLIARSLLYRETAELVEAYAKYTAIINDKSEVREFMNKIREIESRDIKKEFIRECEISLKQSDESAQFCKVQEAVLGMICAGLEDTSFHKWKVNLTDAVEAVGMIEQAGRLPRFSKACRHVEESMDIDFSDIEEEFRVVFEPECVYNTLVLVVTAVKCYREMLQAAYEKNKAHMKNRYKKTKKIETL